jgi:tricorn protease
MELRLHLLPNRKLPIPNTSSCSILSISKLAREGRPFRSTIRYKENAMIRHPSRPSLWPIALATLALLLSPSAQAVEIKLVRHPDYSNGKIVFSYRGDLWLVKEDGSEPRRLTSHRAPSVHPRFSPDGKWIAFSAARYGNHDVFVVSSEGGEARRLTWNSAGDTVVGWTRDSQRVVFSSARGRVYPGIPSLYTVPLDGGMEEAMPADWGYCGSFSPDGKKFVYNRHPMVWSRKHYRGSYAADVWLLDMEARSSRKLLDADVPDAEKPNNFWPMFGTDSIYFVSDRDVRAKAGTPRVMESRNNIWKMPTEGGKPVQVTKHDSGSLFWPSISADGKVIVYEQNFGLWKLDTATGETREIKIDLVADEKDNNLETVSVNGEADNYHLSPSGKRAVVTTHGELFTIATDRGDVRRLTRTSDVRETQPRWSPDGKRIAFIGDQTGSEEIWLCDESGGNLKRLTDTRTQKSLPVWSPDSRSLLYAASDRALHRCTVADGKDSIVARGEVIAFGSWAITNPQWSPDGKWISFTKSGGDLLPHVYIVSAAGGDAKRITDADSYSDSSALWTPDGKALVYLAGLDNGNIGQNGRSTAQIFVVSLTRQEKEPGVEGVDSEEEAARREVGPASRRSRPGSGETPVPPDGDRRDAGPTGRKPDGDRRDAGPTGRKPDGDRRDAGPTGRKPVEVKIDFERMARRARQVTRSGDSVGDMAVSPDSKTLVFVTSGVEGGRSVQSIWSVGLDSAQPARRISQSGSSSDGESPSFRGRLGGLNSLQIAKDGRTLFYRQGSGIYALALGGGAARGGDTATPSAPPMRGRRGAAAASDTSSSSGGARRLSFTARVELDQRARRQQVFQESWRIMKHRFYDPDMHGVDWAKMRDTYEPLLAHVGDQEDLHDVISMMIGELNASHTGISGGRGGRGRDAGGDQTRYPGFELAADPSGFYKVSHVYKDGPADKDYINLNPGDFVLAVDGRDLKAGDNYWKLYTTAPGDRFEFLVNTKPAKDGARSVKIRPVSATQHANLQYQRWVADRRKMVDKLSDGTVGYLHIRQMNESSLRQFERDLAQNGGKKALIIDQRFNPGGGIDQELLQILQQRQYQYTRMRDSVQVKRPLRGFFGPMVVMANERSTSDAEVFPDGFKTLKLGKVVGVTTYGAVIGTGSYSLMDGSTIRTPSVGLWNVNSTNLENYGVPPDVYVDNTPDDFLKDRDAQIEKAVEVLKKDLEKKK